MTLNELLYAFALCLYMGAAAFSFRFNGPFASRLVMAIAVLIDLLLSILPRAGVEALSMHLHGSNQVIVVGVFLGVLVWVLFLLTLLSYRFGRYRLYHSGVLLVELLWFIDFITFLYGMYTVPLH
ncbi:MAG: hypothetical protein HGB29_10125 [Chlorobiaceae bacterium]|nr:hypothetical protein [Chlorobiaceae bacterium]NTW75206.1 hypothetical protein [Chlorobiaceae bacterium]